MTPSRSSRRDLLLGLAVAWPFGGAAFAADAAPTNTTTATTTATYAVLSLVGDEISVVTRRRTTGTQLDPNDRLALPVDDAQLDGVAAAAAERAIQAARPGAAVLRYSIRDARLYALQGALLEPGPQSDPVREALRGLLAPKGVTHLVVVTKRREEARFELADGGAGGGKIAGAGFYIDNLTRTRRVSSGEASVGFVGVYAAVTVTLADAASLRPMAVGHALRTRLWTPADAGNAVVAWQATSEAEKARALDRMIDSAVFAATREALAAR